MIIIALSVLATRSFDLINLPLPKIDIPFEIVYEMIVEFIGCEVMYKIHVLFDLQLRIDAIEWLASYIFSAANKFIENLEHVCSDFY